MRHTANSWRNAWVCMTKLWNVCLCQRPQSRPWRMRLATSCALSSPKSCSCRGRISIAFLPSSLHLCPMTMNSGSKLCSSADALLKQWKSTRSWSTLTGTQERCNTPSCGSLPHECDFDGVPGSADADMYQELIECFRCWGRHGSSDSCSTELAECPARTLLAD